MNEKIKLRKELMRLERLEEILKNNLDAVREEISIVQKEIEECDEKNKKEETKEEVKDEIFLRETTMFLQKQIINCLNRKAIFTLNQLEELEEMDLIRIQGIGKQSVEVLMNLVKNKEIETRRVLENRRKIQEKNHVLNAEKSEMLPSQALLDREGIKTLEDLYEKIHKTSFSLYCFSIERKICRYINQFL